MTLEIIMFGPFADAIQNRMLQIEMSDDIVATEQKILDEIAAQEPRLKPLIASARLAINSEFAQPGRPVSDTDELALVGLVGGG